MVSAREWINELSAYTPGLHYGKGYHDLASNELLDSPPDNIRDAITATFPGLNRYPDSTATALRNNIAEYHQVDPACVLVGNGSDELIYLICLAYLADHGRAVAALPGYRMNEIVTQMVNGTMTRVPLTSWRHDLVAMADVDADVAFVVNPHNPTGTVIESDRLDAFIRRRSASLVVVDEAYIDFAMDAGTRSAISYVHRGDVAVLRTFSKTYGLAGLRIGYIVASPEIIRTLSAIRAPFSVGSVAQAAALAAIQSGNYYSALARETATRRDDLIRTFRDCGFSVTDSKANFVFAFDLDEPGVVDRLGRDRIIVRPGSTLGIPGSLRMTVPTREAMPKIAESLRSFL